MVALSRPLGFPRLTSSIPRGGGCGDLPLVSTRRVLSVDPRWTLSGPEYSTKNVKWYIRWGEPGLPPRPHLGENLGSTVRFQRKGTYLGTHRA
nr:MAG TPA: hypothetical protein [Caudoviricetes sp.]